ncbi:MAG: hypothetical protein ABI689_09915 [Thermoanaerobaculia bacterium]
MTADSRLAAAWRELLLDVRVAALETAAAGVPIHLVGGAVRDAGLGRPVHDLDVVVAHSGAAIAGRLAAATGARLVALGGERFGALRLVSGANQIDIWDLRGGALIADLWRRDFTVNAMALTVPSGALIDPTDGEGDLVRRRLRATRPEVFAEDPVRVLRLARLATTLPGFDADPATVAAARAATPDLAAMPHERLRIELEILFSQPRFAPAAVWCGALDLPAFFFGKGSASTGVSPMAHSTAKRLDDWRASRRASASAALRERAPVASARQALHWSLFTELFFPSHEARASATLDLARRGLLTRGTCDAALALLAPDWRPPADDVARRRWLHTAGAVWQDAIALRATLAGTPAEVEEWRNLEAELLAWPESERLWILTPPALLSGEEVMALLGIAPGPAVGVALARIRRGQVEGVVRVRREAEALLRAGEPGA